MTAEPTGATDAVVRSFLAPSRTALRAALALRVLAVLGAASLGRTVWRCGPTARVSLWLCDIGEGFYKVAAWEGAA